MLYTSLQQTYPYIYIYVYIYIYMIYKTSNIAHIYIYIIRIITAQPLNTGDTQAPGRPGGQPPLEASKRRRWRP